MWPPVIQHGCVLFSLGDLEQSPERPGEVLRCCSICARQAWSEPAGGCLGTVLPQRQAPGGSFKEGFGHSWDRFSRVATVTLCQ